jgi:hypothetical protein
MDDPDKELTAAQIDEFRETGLLVLRDFYSPQLDIYPIQASIYEVIGQVMMRHGLADRREAFRGDNFDAGYADLLASDRTWAGEVYDAVKQIPAFVRLVAHPTNEALLRQLRPGSVPGLAAGGSGIRIDNPHEDRFRTHWHQEYPSQLRSLDGLVMWSPLVPITAAIGPVNFCLGSHKEGPKPVFTVDPNDKTKIGAYALILKDEAALLSKYAATPLLCEPGDLLVVDFLLLHSSGVNRSDRSRWSMQFRYFNFADPTGRSYGWKGSYAAGVDFSVIHPELT